MKYGFGRNIESHVGVPTYVQVHRCADGLYVANFHLKEEVEIQIPYAPGVPEVAKHNGKKFKNIMEALDFLNSEG